VASSGKPLAGVRVIDMTRVMSGPFCTVMLADLGAEVIKIEAAEGDITRHVGGHMRNGATAMFMVLNRGKKSFTVDLTSDAGRTAVAELIATADVFVENFRPGVTEAMGLGADEMRAQHPRLIYVSINGYGRDGAMAASPAYDTVIQGQTAMVARQSIRKGEIDKVRSFPVDKLSGLFASQAILAALFARTTTGEGSTIDVPMFDATMYYLASDVNAEMAFVDGDYTRVTDIWAGPGATATSDGHIVWLSVSLKEIHGAMRAVGLDELTVDERFKNLPNYLANKRDLDRAMADAFLKWMSLDIVERLHAEGVAASIVMQPGDILADPALVDADFFLEADHIRAGRIRQPRPPIRFDRRRQTTSLASPEVGEHTDALLAELGYDSTRIEQLKIEGVIA
jgi:crotonobetainyl-CoA:carnitine CoA-transferase CaiB-like acyl-CoA transferase